MIDFNNDNRPICGPTTEAECTLNWAALQDVWDALNCLGSSSIPVSCAVLSDSIAKEDVTEDGFDVLLDKEEYGESIDACDYDVYVNGLNALYIGDSFSGNEILPQFRVDDSGDNIMVTIVPGSFNTADTSDFYVYKIKVTIKDTLLDLMNACEPAINCRDVE